MGGSKTKRIFKVVLFKDACYVFKHIIYTVYTLLIFAQVNEFILTRPDLDQMCHQ